jgi:hypothetical protein
MASRSWIATVLLVFCFAASNLVRAAEPATLYVSPNGNDKWRGTRKTPNLFRTNGPLASLQGARDAVRHLKSRGQLTRPVTVRVLGGLYRMSEPFVLAPEDSGTTNCSITYIADGGEKAVFSGGRVITGWRKSEKGIWTATIPEVRSGKWYFRSLFVNGQRRQRARTPNDGYFQITDDPPAGPPAKAALQTAGQTQFHFRPGDIKNWDNLGDVDVVIYHAWATTRHLLRSVDTQTNTVKFSGPTRWPLLKWGKNRYVVENAPDALDAPGEWYLDRQRGVLSYMPMPDEAIEKAIIEAPTLTELVRFQGDADAGKLVEHVTLSGLTFACTDWVIGSEGHNFRQAAPDVKPTVTLSGAQHCALDKIEVACVGGYGVGFGHGCKDNRIEQSHIHNLGAGGIQIGEIDLPKQEQARAERNTVYNCFIHDGGHINATAVGVWVGKSSNNVIQHNEISDFYYTGISVGWSWGYQPSSANHNIIEFNHVHHLGFGVLSDMGGIYTLGVSPGTRIRNNCFHHIESSGYGGWGIYTDEGSQDILIESNVVYRTKDGSFHQHYGRDNIVRNNIFAFSRERQIVRTRNEKHRSFVFEHNITYFDQGVLLGSNWAGDRSNYELDYNLYWDASGRALDFAGSTFEQWQAKGQDTHSIIADPLFMDAKGYNFRFKPDSPASKIGFKPIDMANVGLVGPREWVDLPKSVKRKWVESPPKP